LKASVRSNKEKRKFSKGLLQPQNWLKVVIISFCAENYVE
jgi:hypothetical protein